MTYEEEVLYDMSACGKTCNDLAVRKRRVIKDVNWLIENLPGIDYVLERMVNYIFSNGMTTGIGVSEDGALETWLYSKQNLIGATNYSTLREAIKDTIVYGSCGLRMYDGNIYAIKQGYYGILTNEIDGIKTVEAYFVHKKRQKIEKEIDLSDWDRLSTVQEIEKWFDEHDYILLSRDEFCNLRNDTSTLFGYSPLLKDKQRVQLLLSVYERLNYDIVYDGPGRIIIHTSDGYVSDDKNEVSTSEVIDNSPQVAAKRYEDAKAEAARIARDLKDSTSDAVAVMSGAFDSNITHLPRVTKATEFLEWLDVDMQIIAQILGMSETLLEIGDLHGNVSVEKIIDTAMLNSIIPLRESYAIQFSDLIANELGVQKVFFNKYDMAQTQDENELRGKVADIIKNLSYAYASAENEEVNQLITDSALLLKTSLYDTDGNIRHL